MNKGIFLTLPGLELRSLGRSVRSQSHYRLRYRDSDLGKVRCQSGRRKELSQDRVHRRYLVLSLLKLWFCYHRVTAQYSTSLQESGAPLRGTVASLRFGRTVRQITLLDSCCTPQFITFRHGPSFWDFNRALFITLLIKDVLYMCQSVTCLSLRCAPVNKDNESPSQLIS
jgi:hypothetical protein